MIKMFQAPEGLRCNGNAKRGAKKTLGLCGWTSQERETFTDCEKSLPWLI